MSTEPTYIMAALGTPELIVILAIVLVLFGVGKLPSVGQGLGQAIKNFKKAMNENETKSSESSELKPKQENNADTRQ